MRSMPRLTVPLVVSAALLSNLPPASGNGPTPPALNPPVDASRFRVSVFAAGLNFPKSMQQLPDGSLLVATSDPNPGGHYFDSTGTLRRLVDADNEGRADGPGAVLYGGLPGIVTSVRRAGELVLVTSSQAGAERISVLRAGVAASDPYTSVGSIDFGFPLDSYHTTYALAIRDTPGRPGDHDVFFNVGSQANDVASTDRIPVTGLFNASLDRDSIYKVTVHDGGGTPAFTDLTRVATGLRNAAGMAFHPATGDLYFEDNGIDGLVDGNEPLSADELNRIAAADIGKSVPDFGFPHDYIEYRTNVRVGSGAVQPLVAFQPIPDPLTGSESEGPSEIAFTPDAFRRAGLPDGVFVGFHGKFNEGGLANEENPLVFYDLTTGQYFHVIGNDEPGIGHLDGLLATEDSLYVADLSSTGGLFSPDDIGKGVIYRISVVAEPGSLALIGLGGMVLLGAVRARRRAPDRPPSNESIRVIRRVVIRRLSPERGSSWDG